MDIRIRRIEKARDFVALAPIWSRLVSDSMQTSPFLSYDWFWCCWHGVWPQRRPEILLIEEAETPIAIIPLMRWRGRVRGLPIRYISFLEWPCAPAVDLITVTRHDQIVALFLDHLISRSDWDIARLQKLPAASPSVKALEQLLPGRLPWRYDGHQVSPYVSLDGGWDRFARTLNRSFTDPHQYIDTQLQRIGDIRLEEHRLIDPESSLLQEMFTFMTHSPQHSRMMTPVPRQWEFFRVLSQRAAKNGWLSVWTLKLNNRIIAIEYQLRSHGRVEVLLSGGDPAYHSLCPWPALNLAILQALFQSDDVSECSIGPAVQETCLWQPNGYYQTVHLKLYRPSIYARVVAQLEEMSGVERS